MQDYKQEIAEAKKKENWSLRGPNCIVKVLPLDVDATHLGGYITLGRYLIRNTPKQIEVNLGLPKNYLLSGARIYRFSRLPLIHEYEYELTAKYPGGLAYNPAHSHPDYLPGCDYIHQWKIKPGVKIPIDKSKHLELLPSQYLTYEWLVS